MLPGALGRLAPGPLGRPSQAREGAVVVAVAADVAADSHCEDCQERSASRLCARCTARRAYLVCSCQECTTPMARCSTCTALVGSANDLSDDGECSKCFVARMAEETCDECGSEHEHRHCSEIDETDPYQQLGLGGLVARY